MSAEAATTEPPDASSRDMESVRFSSKEGLHLDTGSSSTLQEQADFPDLPTPSEGSVITPDASMLNYFQFDDSFANDLDTRDLIVKVDNPEKHSGTLDSYVTFRVATNTTHSDYDAHEYSVRRRYKDFLWLKQALERSHPGCIIPPLPDRSVLQQRFSQEFLRFRMLGLHQFLNRVVEHPSLCTEPSLKLFLTAKPHEFAARRQQSGGLGANVAGALQSLAGPYLTRASSAPEGAPVYAQLLGDKLACTERIALRIAREQMEHSGELSELHAAFTLWAGSESTLGPSLEALASALDQCSASHKEAAQVLQSRCVPGLHEQTLLVESVKEALQRRCAAQAEYELAKETLAKGKQEHQQLQSPSSGGLSLDALLRRDTAQHRKDKAQRLESSLQQQEEQLELRRGQQEGLSKQLDGELQRWEQHRQGALRKVFLLLAEQQLQCLQQCLSAWEGALVALRKPDPDGTADAST